MPLTYTCFSVFWPQKSQRIHLKPFTLLHTIFTSPLPQCSPSLDSCHCTTPHTHLAGGPARPYNSQLLTAPSLSPPSPIQRQLGCSGKTQRTSESGSWGSNPSSAPY